MVRSGLAAEPGDAGLGFIAGLSEDTPRECIISSIWRLDSDALSVSLCNNMFVR